MEIKLKPQQEAWLKAHVADGAYESVEDAVRQLLDERIAEEQDDLDWAKPYLDEGRAELDRGELITQAEFSRLMAERLKALRDE